MINKTRQTDPVHPVDPVKKKLSNGRVHGKKRLFESGDTVATFTGQAGMVVSAEVFARISKTLKEGKRPGHYFAPGCCHNPDYVIQIPVLFEDGTYDVMRAMNIKKAPDLPEEKRSYIENIINDRTESA